MQYNDGNNGGAPQYYPQQQGYPMPQGMAPQGTPQQGYPPQGMQPGMQPGVPQGMQPGFMPPGGQPQYQQPSMQPQQPQQAAQTAPADNMVRIDMRHESSGWADSKGGSRLEDGVYAFTIKSASSDISDKGNPLLRVDLEVISEKGRGRAFKYQYTLTVGVQRVVGLMKAVFGAAREAVPTEEFVGKCFIAELSSRASSDGARSFYDLSDHKPYTPGGVPQQTPQQPQQPMMNQGYAQAQPAPQQSQQQGYAPQNMYQFGK